MKPLSDFQVPAGDGITGLLFDIDDTLTTRGSLTAAAYAALHRAKAAGLIVVPITGRPAGWCDQIARLWPVDGVVGENGAFYMAYDAGSRKLVMRCVKSEAERAADRVRLDAVAQDILDAVPGAALASDQAYRIADIAIDFCEDVPRLAPQDVERIRRIMEARGLTAKVSSIHVNGWFGGYDKLSTTRLFLAERHGIDLDASASRFVFVGDSPNDAPMFAYFPHSVGVANVRAFSDRLATPPAYVTASECGAGFAEVVDALLGVR
ncbi:MAG: HAD family phosphatase [Betaproteobacteria bacterium]|nr:HAD family phosphatase [Betaproteobacteria bacterium]